MNRSTANMIKPTYLTRPVQRAPAQPDVTTHEDIDWRKVTVAEAIDADRQRQIQQRATLTALKAARAARKRTIWAVLAEMFGARRA